MPKRPSKSNDGTFTFAEWLQFEPQRIVSMGLTVKDDENRRLYMRAQIEAAIRCAYSHGKKGRSADDLISHTEGD